MTPTGRRTRSDDAAEKAWEQATRQRWRALHLVVKAKLEAVESGITVFDDEFLAHIVLPDGGTVGRWMRLRVGVDASATGDRNRAMNKIKTALGLLSSMVACGEKHTASSRDVVKAAHTELAELHEEIVCLVTDASQSWEWDDPRLGYVTVQVDKPTLQTLVDLIEFNTSPTPRGGS